jgi:hypothetical protein
MMIATPTTLALAVSSLLLTTTLVLPLTLAATADENEVPCGLYVAPSSTQEEESGTTTWGLYAGAEIAAGTVIGAPELAINAWHLKANAIPAEDHPRAAAWEEIVDFFESYIWVPEPVGGKFESPEGRMVTAVPGPGVLSAFNIKLTNANWKHVDAYARPAWNEQAGVSHPGRGASSNLYQATIHATIDIAKGSEIFMDYGENWAEEEKREALRLEDYKNLDATIGKMISFFDKNDDLHAVSKTQIYQFLTRDVMTAAVGHYKAKTVAKLLPDKPEDLKEIPAKGGILVHSAPTVYRQPEWLQENGFCVDYLVPGPSTIPFAGRGALAKRKIPAGTIVTASPLVQIPDVSILDLHPVEIDPADGDFMRKTNEVTGQQLLLNYVYGHPQSTMVFFPSGPMAGFINHSKKAPNAKLQWSSHASHSVDWYQKTPDEVMAESNLGLIMEVVALKDIPEGEEILVDYGDEWQAAWEAHVAAWPAKEEWPWRAVDYNEKYRKEGFETAADLGKDPVYPDNVQIKAFLMIEESLRAGTKEDPKFWSMPEGGTAYDSDNLFGTTVIEKNEVDGTNEYLIRWTNNHGEGTFVDKVPQDALVFVDAPGQSDFFTDKPFRHYIGIPDDIFPQGPWRNKTE